MTFTDPGDETTDAKGTTWIEIFATFDLLGFNPQQTRENDAAQIMVQQADPRQHRRQQLWIQHRMKNRLFAKQGLRKPLATAECKRDLSTELDNFIRITRFLVKRSGSKQAVDIFRARNDGYHGGLVALAIDGSHPTIRGSLILNDQQASRIAYALVLHRTGHGTKLTSVFKNFQNETICDKQTTFQMPITTLTTRAPPPLEAGE